MTDRPGTLPADVLEAHAVALCREHDVARLPMGVGPASEDGGRGPRADVLGRVVYVPPISDESSYYATLHEVGHVVLGPGDDALPRWVNEVRVWAWTRDVALIWDARAEAFAAHSLDTYGAGDWIARHRAALAEEAA